MLRSPTVVLLFVLLTILFMFLDSVDYIPNIPNISIMSPATPIVKNPVILVNNSKWIVVTSINSPTEDVKRLSMLDGWSLVVVADTKTPKDWRLPGVHFLSTEAQAEMGLKLPMRLPFKTYTRKTVGYLFAIMHGAKWIYDTDDDNKPFGLGLEQFDYSEIIGGLRYRVSSNTSTISEKLFNPYRFFGAANMWPRGFPLEHIINHTNGKDRYLLCYEMQTSAVQQGLVHKDPDVDAIYRLLHAIKETGLNERFNKFAPPVVMEKGTYAPWNSQNTLFNYRAFFTMFLPTTVEFRGPSFQGHRYLAFLFCSETLHLIGETVAFYPVNAVQIRNAHTYLADFEDEHAVYKKSGKIVEFLDKWNCTYDTIQKCTKELAEEFSERGFISSADVGLISLWLDDLTKIGYEFPKLSTGEIYDEGDPKVRGANCRRAHIEFPTVNMENKTQPNLESAVEKLNSFGEILDWCRENSTNSSESSGQFGLPSPAHLAKAHAENPVLRDKMDSVLVVVNNYPWKQAVGVLQRLYSAYFATTVFCATWSPQNYRKNETFPPKMEPFNYIHLSPDEMAKGFFGYYCLSKIRDLQLQNVKGYYVIADDSVFNVWNPNNMSLVATQPLNRKIKESWWKGKHGKAAAERVSTLINTTYANNSNMQASWIEFEREIIARNYSKSAAEHMATYNGRSAADFYYIPSSKLDYFANLWEVFNSAGLFLEIAMSKVVHTVDLDPKAQLDYLWGDDRNKWTKQYNESSIMLHAIKFSQFENDLKQRKMFCDTVVSAFKKNLYRIA